MTTQEVADYLRIPIATLYGWRARGEGPKGFRVGKFVRFREADVRRWLDAQADPRSAA